MIILHPEPRVLQRPRLGNVGMVETTPKIVKIKVAS